MKALAFVFALLALSVSSAQTLYKWVDARGNISYSDRPPPPDQQNQDLSKTLNTLGAGEAQADLGYDTNQLLARSPIVLYTARGCAPCEQARTYLKGKGWPYSEKTVNSAADAALLDQQFNAQSLPILTIGPSARIGFSAADWDTSLAAAGYSANTTVPKGYVTGKIERMSAPEAATGDAAAPVPKATQTTAPSASAADDSRPFVRQRRAAGAADANTTPNIQF